MAYMRLTMDGTTYRVKLVYDTMVRHFEILQGVNAGPMLAGNEEFDDQGTGFSYQLRVEPDVEHLDDYYDFYEAITTPGVTHRITVPYNNTTISYEAKVLSGDDTFGGKLSGDNLWKGLTVNYRYVTPQKEAGA